MCGITFYKIENDIIDNSEMYNKFMKTSHRGPDNSCIYQDDEIFMGFHRLSINDVSNNGNQPFSSDNIYMICNGEIYNSEYLKKKYNIQTDSESDCEIVLQLYKKIGFYNTITELDGVFAIILIDKSIPTDIKIFASRDIIGVRSMYFGYDKNEQGMITNFGFTSELKGLIGIFSNVEQFKPSCIWSNQNFDYQCYYNKDIIYRKNCYTDVLDIKRNVSKLLENAIDKRLMSDQPIGCLLSGGLDSSIVAALLNKKYNNLHTFSIGLEGSTDLKYAKMVADHLNTIHHEVIVTENEMLNVIKDDIYYIETYDTTTIRASTPMMLLSKYIQKHTNIKVIYSGEGSDEASGSYLYFHNAPNETLFRDETIRLINDLSYFDVLRCDKSVAAAGLEVRVPFLDKQFLEYYMNICPSLKIPSYGNIEKYLLRITFSEGEYANLLPSDVIRRTKEGMSDGVSSLKRGWFEIIQEYANKIYTVNDFESKKQNYTFNKPRTREQLWFRELFDSFFPNCEQTVPYYWLPKWSGNITEASARVLNVYKQ